MNRIHIILVTALGLTGAIQTVKAQNPPPPDCILFINNLTAVGNTGQFDNRTIGCNAWTLTYQASGFSGLTLTFQSATGATAAGTFGTYGGTVVTGVNPNTDTTGRITQFSNGLVVTPWVRVNLSGLTGAGTVNGVVYGYKTGYSGGNGGGGGSGCTGTVATPCTVDGPVADGGNVNSAKPPVLIAGADLGFPQKLHILATDSFGNVSSQVLGAPTALMDANTNNANVPTSGAATLFFPGLPYLFNGNTWDRQIVCTSRVIVDDSTMGNVQIIAASGGTQIRICKMTLTTAASVGVQLTQGTGANCGTGTANLSGLYQNASSIAEDFAADQSVLISTVSQAVCLNLAAGTRTTGQILYSQF